MKHLIPLLALATLHVASLHADIYYLDGVTPEAIQQIGELHAALDYDATLGSVRAPLDSASLVKLEEAYAGHEALASFALYLTLIGLDADMIPARFVEDIVVPHARQLRRQEERTALDRRVTEALRQIAARTIWIVRMRALSPQDGAQFAIEFVESGAVADVDYIDYSLELIREEGSPESTAALRAFASSDTVSRPIQIRAVISLRKAGILEQLSTSSAARAAQVLTASVLTAERLRSSIELSRDYDQNLVERSFVSWAVHQLGDLHTPEGDSALRDIATNEAISTWPRVIAQALLFQRGALREPYELVIPPLARISRPRDRVFQPPAVELEITELTTGA